MKLPEFKQYRRKSVSEMRQILFGEDMSGISISEPDRQLMRDNPNLFQQGYVARNPKNHEDLWYVAKDYFDDNLEPIDQPTRTPVDGERFIELQGWDKYLIARDCKRETVIKWLTDFASRKVVSDIDKEAIPDNPISAEDILTPYRYLRNNAIAVSMGEKPSWGIKFEDAITAMNKFKNQ